jgi:hypothetical protein
MGLAPGKGFYGDAVSTTLDFLHQTLEEIWNVYGENGDEEYADEGDEGLERFLKDLKESTTGWATETDKFGKKVFKTLAWGSQADGSPTQYRITVVLARGALHVDVRTWYEVR